MKKPIPKSQRESEIAGLCLGSDYSFVGWAGEYSGKDSKAEFNCVRHGNWLASVHSFVNGGKRCKICGDERSAQGRRAKPEQIRQRIEDAMNGTEILFCEFETEYENLFTRAVLECPTHGRWSASVGNILNAKSKCPGCCKTGFSNGRLGVLYALRSDCGVYVKVGITNNLPSRLRVLRRKTPFSFIAIETIKNRNGKIIRELEKHLHLVHQSAGFSGFDGATEWLLFTAELRDDLISLAKRFSEKDNV